MTLGTRRQPVMAGSNPLRVSAAISQTWQVRPPAPALVLVRAGEAGTGPLVAVTDYIPTRQGTQLVATACQIAFKSHDVAQHNILTAQQKQRTTQSVSCSGRVTLLASYPDGLAGNLKFGKLLSESQHGVILTQEGALMPCI